MGQGSMGGDSMMRMMSDHMRMMSDMMRMGAVMPGASTNPNIVDMSDRIEVRIAFLRGELRITDAQMPAWNSFAEALRSGRRHLVEARQVFNQPSASPADHLQQYERHLAARLEALKTARTSFVELYNVLDQTQRRTADDLVAPFIATF